MDGSYGRPSAIEREKVIDLCEDDVEILSEHLKDSQEDDSYKTSVFK